MLTARFTRYSRDYTRVLTAVRGHVALTRSHDIEEGSRYTINVAVVQNRLESASINVVETRKCDQARRILVQSKCLASIIDTHYNNACHVRQAIRFKIKYWRQSTHYNSRRASETHLLGRTEPSLAYLCRTLHH